MMPSGLHLLKSLANESKERNVLILVSLDYELQLQVPSVKL